MEEKNLGKISIETKNFESGFHWDKKIWDKVPVLELEIFWKNFPMRQNFLRKVSIETKYIGTGFLVLGHLSLESGGKGTISCWDKMQLGQKKLGQISVFFKFLGSKYEGTKCFWDTFLRKDFLWVSLLWDKLPRDDYQGPHYRAPFNWSDMGVGCDGWQVHDRCPALLAQPQVDDSHGTGSWVMNN